MLRFVNYSGVWLRSSTVEIDLLIGGTVSGGADLESVLGVRQSTVRSGGPRWLGFYASPTTPSRPPG